MSLDKAFMESYYATYNSEDPEALRAYYQPNVVLASAQGEQQGAESILETYRYLIAHFSDQMTPENIEITDDMATVDILDRFVAKTVVPDFMGRSFNQGDEFELRLQGKYQLVDGKFQRIDISMRS